jgi:hypothetical protein
MQHTFKIDEIFGTHACNMCVKHMQHPHKNNYNMKKDYLQHKTETAETFRTYVATYMQHPDKNR